MSRKQQNQNMRIYRPGMLQVGNYTDTKRNNSRLPVEPPIRKKPTRVITSLLFIAVIIGALVHFTGDGKSVTYHSDTSQTISSVSSKPLSTECSSNNTPKLIKVILNQQHLWACDYSKVAYSSPVVTGYNGNPADVTPIGSYHIYSKQTNLTLIGTDGVTSWHDPVSYWMQFLSNKYGKYGLHDATWRTPDQFGKVSTSSTNASHGCVELPINTAKWLYSWAPIGTSLDITQT